MAIFLGGVYIFVLFLAFNKIDNYVLDLIASFRGQLIYCLVLISLLLFLKIKKTAMVLLSISFVLLLAHYAPFQSKFNITKEDKITVKLINLHYYNQHIKTVLQDFYEENTWDILVLQEFNDTHRSELTKFNEQFSLYGYDSVEGSPFGIVVVSRLPIIFRYLNTQENRKLGYIKLGFLKNDEVLYGFFLHPPSPRSKELWMQRNQLLRVLTTAVTSTDSSWFITGDLNTVSWSRYFPSDLGETCVDAYGIYSSWSPFSQLFSEVTGVPIDHCIVSGNIKLREVYLSTIKGSDHRSLTFKMIER
ncbi:endonuclease/exonuclease/phosphatase family protein [Pseudoalteromonas neustonica]|uniref:Endonuclease/exonuclease/phosphatase family protein n=1 Tax=Pseudoalteromonas neustonica TaxID=1840331 RepID=A0ABU9U4N3_9GAMM